MNENTTDNDPIIYLVSGDNFFLNRIGNGFGDSGLCRPEDLANVLDILDCYFRHKQSFVIEPTTIPSGSDTPPWP